LSHFEEHFEGANTFLTPSIVPSAARDNLGVKKVESRSFLNSGTLIVIISNSKGNLRNYQRYSTTFAVAMGNKKQEFGLRNMLKQKEKKF
jgi:hypothetical protein